ncbi:hypothetical protein SynWH8103_00089 [Synechococcus sp. WH 8103]|nr:hypothetical protein SynWH8103_00089 [Synechococcus sp. WH 8103]
MVEHLLAKERVESSNLFIRFDGFTNLSEYSLMMLLHQHCEGRRV